MSNIIVAFDHLDDNIGENLLLCFEDFKSQVDINLFNIIELDGNKCCNDDIQVSITSFNQANFILIAYSHGKKDALISKASPNGYVSLNNSYFFSGSLVYTNSCHTAIELKDALIFQGCLGYVGYNDEVMLPEKPEHDLLFIRCENKAILHFLSTNDTLTESVEVMKKYYEETYDSLAVTDVLMASRLLDNKRHIVYFDDYKITKSHFTR